MDQAIIEFWFGDWRDDVPVPENSPQMALWWGKDPAVDAEMRDRFGSAHFNAAARQHADALGVEGVAAILLLDQVPRNIFRGTPHMFATDGLARQHTRLLLAGDFESLASIHRYFALMPLMHAEDLPSHDLAVREFSRLADETKSTPRARSYAGAVDYEAKHRAIIERFGRYPHRNAILGRTSTEEERAFLETPGSSF